MPTPAYFSLQHASGATLSVTVQKLSGALDQYFDPSDKTFKTGLTYSQKKVALVGGLNENAGSYDVSIVGLSGNDGLTDPGLVRIRVHDEGDSNKTIAIFEFCVVDGALVRLDALPSTRATPAQVLTQLSTFVNSSFLIPELAVLPGRTPTIAQVMALTYLSFRWKTVSTDNRFQMYNADGTLLFESILTRDETSFARGEMQNVG